MIFDQLQKYGFADINLNKQCPFFSSIRNEPEFIKIESDVEVKIPGRT